MAEPRSASEGPTDFGYRLKVPIALTVVALVSGVLVAGTTYTAELTGLTDDLDLYVLDQTQTNVLCDSWNFGTAAEACSFTPGTGTVYVYVDGSYASSASGFTLDLY